MSQQSDDESDDVYGEKEIQNGFYALIRANYLQRMESSNSVFKPFAEEPNGWILFEKPWHGTYLSFQKQMG